MSVKRKRETSGMEFVKVNAWDCAPSTPPTPIIKPMGSTKFIYELDLGNSAAGTQASEPNIFESDQWTSGTGQMHTSTVEGFVNVEHSTLADRYTIINLFTENVKQERSEKETLSIEDKWPLPLQREQTGAQEPDSEIKEMKSTAATDEMPYTYEDPAYDLTNDNRALETQNRDFERQLAEATTFIGWKVEELKGLRDSVRQERERAEDWNDDLNDEIRSLERDLKEAESERKKQVQRSIVAVRRIMELKEEARYRLESKEVEAVHNRVNRREI